MTYGKVPRLPRRKLASRAKTRLFSNSQYSDSRIRTYPGPIVTPSQQSLFAHFDNQLFTMANTDYNTYLDLALADLAQKDKSSSLDTSKRYNVIITTLRDQYLSEQSSRQAVTPIHHNNLTDADEEALISLINCPTNRGLPPIYSIVKNPAEEILQRLIDIYSLAIEICSG